MTYAVNFETTPRVIAVKLSTGGMMHASFGSVQYVNTGKQGIDGTTFYPSVEGDECTLSWTNDGNKENPKPVNLRGRQGPQGAPGSDADILPITNLELEKLLISRKLLMKMVYFTCGVRSRPMWPRPLPTSSCPARPLI